MVEAARSAAFVDRSRIALDVGVRAAAGVAACLVVGRLTGHTVAGVTATIGALSAGMASHQGTYRSRAAVVLAAAAAMGFSAFVGSSVGHIEGVDIAVTAAISFCAALLVCLGPSGSVVGIQAVVGLVVFSQFKFPLAVAARDGGLVLLGGAVQAALVIGLWPLRRFPAERRFLSTAYTHLAESARSVAAGGSALLPPGAFDGVEAVWRDAQPFGGDEAAAHRVLAAQADRIRLELVALARARARLGAAGAVSAAAALNRVLVSAGRVLEGTAEAIRDGTSPAVWEEERPRFEAARTDLAASQPAPDPSARAELVRRVDALAGQLRTVLRAAAVAAGADISALDEAMVGAPQGSSAHRRGGLEWVREQRDIIRSNLTFSSQACRHATRMAATLAVAVAVSHAFPWNHRYWLPMTAMLVLRPDFTSTVARGISRVVGTLFGAGIVTVALAELRPSADWLIGLVVLLCIPATTLVLANYAIYSVCIASLVVTLLAFTGNPELATAGDRSFYTAAGAALAFLAYALWPTWEKSSLPDTLAHLAEVEGRYAGAVLRAWSAPSDADRDQLQRDRLEARLARSNAEASVTRWLAEPRSAVTGLTTETVSGYMAAIRSCVQAVMALHAELPAEGEGRPELAELAAGVSQAFGALSDQVKGSPSVPPLPPLRSEQVALTATLNGDGRAAVLAGETDLLVNSINTLGHLVGLEPG